MKGKDFKKNDWPPEQMIEWLPYTYWLTDFSTDWQTDLSTDWQTDLLSDLMYKQMIEWLPNNFLRLAAKKIIF